MDITQPPKETYKEIVKDNITDIKKDDEHNDEEIIHIFQENFIGNYCDSECNEYSETSNLETISINTTPPSERYYSLSNHSSSDELSSISSDCRDTKICSKLAKYFLKTCFLVDTQE